MRKIIRNIYRLLISMTAKFNHKLFNNLFYRYLKKLGIDFQGKPKFISSDVYFDSTDYKIIRIGKDVVISMKVIFLTHDFSITRGLQAINKETKNGAKFVKGITIGTNCFIGAGTIILPGTIIGNNVIVGAGTVLRGKIADDSIVIGNPCQIIGNTKEWAEKKREGIDYIVNYGKK